MIRPIRPLSLAALALLLACGSSAAQALRTENVATGFFRPVYLTAPAGDTERLFVVEKRGVIQLVKNGTVLPSPFLDIQSLVLSSGNEQGLLGLAFDPDYDTNGLFYVYYIRPGGSFGTSQISRFSVSANPDVADAASELRILEFPQYRSNHNGGHIEFGPDGYLYFGAGDGGSANDPNNYAQTGSILLGKMIRIDVDGDDFPADPARNYAIPASNPFVGDASFLDEIWAYGLRNPYRWCFDEATGDMYIADVGQNCWEEVSIQPGASTGGENYGWRIREGTRCFSTSNPFDCNQPTGCGTNLVDPVREYNHSTDGFSCSITGGRVYHGSAIAGLDGTYFYADYCSNQIYSFRWDGASVTELTKRTSQLSPAINGGTITSVTAFGRDGVGELYIVKETTSGSGGTIFKIVPDPAAVDSPRVDPPQGFGLSAPAPNPFGDATRLELQLDRTVSIDVAVFDAAGRRVRTLRRGVTPAGLVPVRWDGRDVEGRALPSGVYFVRALAGERSATQRVALIR